MHTAELEPEPVLHALQFSITETALQTDTRLPQAVDRDVNNIGHRATISDPNLDVLTCRRSRQR